MSAMTDQPPLCPAGIGQAGEHLELQRRLSAVFTGPFSRYRDTVSVGDGAPGALAGRDMLSPVVMDRICRGYARRYGTDDQRALLSMWSKSYADTVMPATMVASLVFGRTLPVALDDLRMALDDDGCPIRMILPHGGTDLPADSDVFMRFSPLIKANLEPVMAVLARQGGLSARALWGNVASHFEWIVKVLQSSGAISDEAASECGSVLATRIWPGASFTPVAEALRPGARNRQGLRWRRVCCVRYLIPSLARAFCSNCPITRQRPR